MIKNIDINLLKEAEYNPRKELDPKTYEKLKKSIQEFGEAQPLVVNSDYTVIAGHQRLKVMKRLGFKEVECKVLNLTKEREKALNLALNKIQGEWDNDKLTSLIGELFDEELTEFTGFDDKEIIELIKITENSHETDILDELIEETEKMVSGTEKKEIERPASVPLDTLKGNTEERDQEEDKEKSLHEMNISSRLKDFVKNKTETKVEVNFSLNEEQNEIVVKAINVIKQRDSLTFSAEAIAKICEEWLENE